jgi:hypothetical protein
MLHRVAPVRTDVSEELSASIIRVTRIGELGTANSKDTQLYKIFLEVKRGRRVRLTTTATSRRPKIPQTSTACYKNTYVLTFYLV